MTALVQHDVDAASPLGVNDGPDLCGIATAQYVVLARRVAAEALEVFIHPNSSVSQGRFANGVEVPFHDVGPSHRR